MDNGKRRIGKKYPMRPEDNDKIFRECGPGWNHLIDPLIKRCTELGGIVDQVKEKYGTLRFYYMETGPASEDLWAVFQGEVDDAEHQSHMTCEMCGKRGYTLVKGGWLKTLCREHALELGYKERP
jgi:hypothetical protein